MIDTFIFDWSGVLSDDTQPVYEANMMLLADYGRKRITLRQWKRCSAFSAAGFLRNCGIEADEAETYETYKEYLNELIGRGMHPEMIEGVDKTLEQLLAREKRLIVLSAHPNENLLAEIQAYGMNGMFSHVAGNTIDKAEGLRKLRTRFGFDGMALYTGDTIHDVRASKEAQVKCCAVTTGYHLRERLEAENPDYLFEDLSGIVTLA